jgi:hypothetical protein
LFYEKSQPHDGLRLLAATEMVDLPASFSVGIGVNGILNYEQRAQVER